MSKVSKTVEGSINPLNKDTFSGPNGIQHGCGSDGISDRRSEAELFNGPVLEPGQVF